MSGVNAPSTRRRAGWAALALGALGVVFGDIGTSPLYALQTVFSIDHNEVAPTPLDVYGVISLVFWSIMLIVSVKYVVFVLRADNDGEGGIMALAALTRRHVRTGGRRWKVAMVLGVLGASLFYGDSVITPAISVMSAIEGLSVPAPGLAHWQVPLGALVITALFAVQRRGTHVVGRFFGPVMILWFVAIGALGLVQIVRDPHILSAVLPTHAVAFALERPWVAFVAMGAVVLSITGAEALYADMGHFGRSPIRRAWFGLVLPCLLLNYMGQGSLILDDPSASRSPFFLLAPSWAQLPLVVLATAATVIASQAVISGAFSVSRQAERLGYLPRLTVRQTSPDEAGQIYVPAVNWLLFAGVMTLLVVFRTSDRLATAYGLAVTGTLLLTSALFVVHVRHGRGWSWQRIVLVMTPILLLELTFFAANVTKLLTGGWIPLVVALAIATVMFTWQRGRDLVTERRTKLEGPLEPFIEGLRASDVASVPGTAVYLHFHKETAPLALRENVAFNHVLHHHVLLVTCQTANRPYIPLEERLVVDDLGDPHDGIHHVTLRFGFLDEQDVPAALAVGCPVPLDVDLEGATYFLSRITVEPGPDRRLPLWRKRLFMFFARNAANPATYFNLPIGQTVVMGARVRF